MQPSPFLATCPVNDSFFGSLVFIFLHSQFIKTTVQPGLYVPELEQEKTVNKTCENPRTLHVYFLSFKDSSCSEHCWMPENSCFIYFPFSFMVFTARREFKYQWLCHGWNKNFIDLCLIFTKPWDTVFVKYYNYYNLILEKIKFRSTSEWESQTWF